MKRIPLTKGKFAIVDDADFDELNQFKWLESNGYAARNATVVAKTRRPMIRMHAVILGEKEGFRADHISGDRLDNRRANLRFATKQQNSFNRGKNRNNKSGFKGVSWDKGTEKWRTVIHVGGKKIHVGLYEDAADASVAFGTAAKVYHGEFAHT